MKNNRNPIKVRIWGMVAGISMATMCQSNSILAAGFLSNPANKSLSNAHSAYLSRDFKTMATELKNTLKEHPNDPLIRENAFSLLRQAYDISGTQGVPVDWRLPEEVTKMKVAVRLVQRDMPEYSFEVYGEILQENLFRQLKVTRYPDQVILDKKTGIGEWEESPNVKEKMFEYNFRSTKSRQPIPGGLYLLSVELSNGKSVDGWFLIDDNLNSSATPNVIVPAYGETLHTGNPTFRWDDFHSPEYKPSERRSLWIGIARVEAPNYDWEPKWSMYADAPDLNEVIIGTHSEGEGVSKLEDGHYHFRIQYNERRRFGDLIIGRQSITHRPFSIK